MGYAALGSARVKTPQEQYDSLIQRIREQLPKIPLSQKKNMEKVMLSLDKLRKDNLEFTVVIGDFSRWLETNTNGGNNPKDKTWIATINQFNTAIQVMIAAEAAKQRVNQQRDRTQQVVPLGGDLDTLAVTSQEILKNRGLQVLGAMANPNRPLSMHEVGKILGDLSFPSVLEYGKSTKGNIVNDLQHPFWKAFGLFANNNGYRFQSWKGDQGFTVMEVSRK